MSYTDKELCPDGRVDKSCLLCRRWACVCAEHGEDVRDEHLECLGQPISRKQAHELPWDWQQVCCDDQAALG